MRMTTTYRCRRAPDEGGIRQLPEQELALKLRDLGRDPGQDVDATARASATATCSTAHRRWARKPRLLVVVMSPNWMQRPYCRKELETFAELRKKGGVPNVQERMIVVGKGHVDG